MSRVRHCWPGTGAHLRLVHDVRDTKTEQARRGFDDAFDTRIEPWSFPHFADAIRKAQAVSQARKDEPVVYLDNGLCARFMRAVDRVLAKVWR